MLPLNSTTASPILSRSSAQADLAAYRDGPRRILIVTDAWEPQVNGVVRTLKAVAVELTAMGHRVRFATPQNEMTVPLPTYPQVRLALFPRHGIQRTLEDFAPDAIHIATEGTMGLSARRLCLQKGFRFSTSFHTHFPEYVHARFPWIPQRVIYGALRKFHTAASATMVATTVLQKELEQRGFTNLALWPRGVDIGLFAPAARKRFDRLGLGITRPLFLYVGRLAVEKNVEAFLALDLPGTKLVVGDGPQRAELERRFPKAVFIGERTDRELAALYAASDVFVFPSRTDTFGLVLLEALACGTPIAAYPVNGALDILDKTPVAALAEDLRTACLAALAIPRTTCREFAQVRSWRKSAEQFLGSLTSVS